MTKKPDPKCKPKSTWRIYVDGCKHLVPPYTIDQYQARTIEIISGFVIILSLCAIGIKMPTPLNLMLLISVTFVGFPLLFIHMGKPVGGDC